MATRNASTHKVGLGRTQTGPSKTVESLMVRIDWTSAPTVTIEAKKDFELQALTIDTRTGKTVKQVSVKVLAGTVLHFCKSSFDGLYYIGRVSGAGHVACSCPSHQNRHTCKHEPLIITAHGAKLARKCQQVATECQTAVKCLPIGNDLSPICPSEEEKYVREEVDEEAKAERWTAEELTHEERRAFWEDAYARQRAEDAAFKQAFLAKARELRAQPQAPQFQNKVGVA